MIANTIKSTHEGDFKDEYYTPEYIAVTVTDPVTATENGKPIYTTYKISTSVILFFVF